MSVKRSRVGSSSNQLSAPVSATPAKVMRSESASGEPSTPPPPRLLTFNSPMSAADGSDQLRIGGFLELCHYCKKRISQNSEVFMYSNLCAFCSADCRDRQIALDKSDEMARGKST